MARSKKGTMKQQKGAPMNRIGMMGAIAAMKAMMSGIIPGRDMTDFIPKVRVRSSKYNPHQGSQEKARRVKQGRNGTNMLVVAKPSQDFRYSHWNNPKLRKLAEKVRQQDEAMAQ